MRGVEARCPQASRHRARGTGVGGAGIGGAGARGTGVEGSEAGRHQVRRAGVSALRGKARGRGLGLLPLLGAAGCGLLFEDPGPPVPSSAERAPERSAPTEVSERAAPTAEGLPTGQGTLRQEEIAIRIRRGELEIYVVPLHEGVTRTAAPDTWARLSALAASHRGWFRERTGSDAPYALFLVALYSEAEPLFFEAEELTLVSGGIRQRHTGIRGLTPGWDQARLQPGEAQMAVYAFPPQVTLDADLEVEYREVRSRDWVRILQVVQAEQARIRARGGG